MKHHLYFLVIISLIANSCTAMQTIQITQELPALKHQRYISFLTNEELIIQGKETWDIIDSKTHKTITTLEDTPNPAKIDIHPNHKTFMIFGKDKINIYDTKTKELLCQYLSRKQEIDSAQFDPLNNNSIYIIITASNASPFAQQAGYHTLMKCDYHSKTNLMLRTSTANHKFFIHPINPSLCYLNQDCLTHPNHKHVLTLPFIPYDIFYNPNGSVIIARHFGKIITIDPLKLKLDKCLQRDTVSESFEDVKMYSNNLLALLVGTGNGHNECLYLTFYNIADLLPDFQRHYARFWVKVLPVAQTEKIAIETIWERKLHTFSFSPNGKQCMISFHHKALLFDIPFEIIYEPEAKKRLSHLLFVLKNYEIQLPLDIFKLLLQTSLETYNRYHLNALPLKK